MDRYELTAAVAILAAIAALGWGAYAFDAAACSAKWAGTYPSDYSFLAGCRIEVAPGKWLPADNYREVAE